MEFTVPADHRIKLKEREKKNKYLDLAWELKKKTMEHEGDDYTTGDWCFYHSHHRIIKGTGGLRIWRTSGVHPNSYIIENGQNTEKSPGNMRGFAVSQIPVKDHQQTMM